jgi:hypothetical protein
MRARFRPAAAAGRQPHGVSAAREWVQRPIAVLARGREARSKMGESRREIVSYDALMRWEWEGGAPATVSERDEAGIVSPARTDQLVPGCRTVAREDVES